MLPCYCERAVPNPSIWKESLTWDCSSDTLCTRGEFGRVTQWLHQLGRHRFLVSRTLNAFGGAPHIGMDDQFRSLFWQELVASVKYTQQTLPDIPIVLSGDANVWWPELHLGRERPRDRFIFPYIRELLEGCGLSLRNPFARATHVAGAALDMVFISEECVTEHCTVHQGDGWESNHSGRLSCVSSELVVIPSYRSMLSRDKRLLLHTRNASELQENVFGNQNFYV